MKLAFCLFKYFPYGGLQRDFLRIATICHQRGHEIHVYTLSWEGECPSFIHLHHLEKRGWQNHARQRAFAQQMKAVLKTEKYARVIGFNKLPGLDIYFAGDVCYQARVRKQRHGWYRLLPRYRQQVALEKAVFARGNATQILLMSAHQQQEFTQYYQTETERFHLLPPGISKDSLAPANAADIRREVRATYGLSESDVLLLMVGSGFKTKGVDRAITALAALPDAIRKRCRLFIAGEGESKSFVNLAKTLQVNNQVRFLGGRPDVQRFLLGADILLHPSYHESAGKVLLEALAAGLPILTVAACGYAPYIEEAQAGIVVPEPFEQAQFNVALQHMLSTNRHQWQQNGITFTRRADIFNLPEKAADFILGQTS